MDTLTQPVDASDVNRAYRAVHRAHGAISMCGLALLQGATEEAQARRLEAQGAAEEAAQTLRQMGAEPVRVASSTVDPLSLSALETLDTPDARELLDLLTRAQVVAERVDASRGRTVADGVPLLDGESRGTDLAESLSHLALRVRRDVEGAKGRE